jgi:hypothetical protein
LILIYRNNRDWPGSVRTALIRAKCLRIRLVNGLFSGTQAPVAWQGATGLAIIASTTTLRAHGGHRITASGS